MTNIKVSFIGAGSYGFTFKLVVDILSMDALKECELSFMDVSQERLDNLKIILDVYLKKAGYSRKAVFTLNMEESLQDANFVINLTKIGFLEASEMDMDAAKKYGLYQTIGDTGGLGGVFRGLRTMIFNQKMLAVMEKVSAPGVIVLNYTNPQAMSVMAASASSRIPFIGLCHSVQGTTNMIAKYLGVPYSEMKYEAAGINHLSWVTKLERDGVDLYPEFRRLVKERGIYNENVKNDDINANLGPTRFDIMNRVGYMVTESSIHFAEYGPFYLRTQEMRERYKIHVDKYKVNIRNKEKNYKEIVEAAKKGELPEVGRSVEYGAKIINSMVTDIPCRIYGNVMNTGLITNLPSTACVEVACMVDRNGVHPCYYGKLPTQLATLCNMQINVYQLAVEAVINKDRKSIYWALMADPATHSVLTIDQIEEVVDELIAGQQEYLGSHF